MYVKVLALEGSWNLLLQFSLNFLMLLYPLNCFELVPTLTMVITGSKAEQISPRQLTVVGGLPGEKSLPICDQILPTPCTLSVVVDPKLQLHSSPLAPHASSSPYPQHKATTLIQ